MEKLFFTFISLGHPETCPKCEHSDIERGVQGVYHKKKTCQK